MAADLLKTKKKKKTPDPAIRKIMKCHPICFILLTSAVSMAAETTPVETTRSLPDDTQAQFDLARTHLHGEGVPRNPKKAFELMSAAAARNHPEAVGGLGYFHSKGISVPKNAKLAEEYFRKGAELGSAKSQLNYGRVLIDKDLPEGPAEGVAWVRKAAESGLPDAALAYGRMLYFGDYGLKADPRAAASYLIVAAKEGLAEAQNMMGLVLESGVNGDSDPAGSIDWFRKAAIQGNCKAQSNLGRALDPLAADPQIRTEALAWLMVAEAGGEITATRSLTDAMPAISAVEVENARTLAMELRGKIRKEALLRDRR